MKDKEIRGLVLEKFYELRHMQDAVQLNQILPVFPDEPARVANICEQLAENGLIQWNPLKALGGTFGGIGKITAAGVDVVDGDARPPFSITLHDHRVTVSDSTGVIIGSGNNQTLNINKRRIESAIEQSKSSPEEKNEAKSLLDKIISNPTLWAAINGFLGAIGAQ